MISQLIQTELTRIPDLPKEIQLNHNFTFFENNKIKTYYKYCEKYDCGKINYYKCINCDLIIVIDIDIGNFYFLMGPPNMDDNRKELFEWAEHIDIKNSNILKCEEYIIKNIIE